MKDTKILPLKNRVAHYLKTAEPTRDNNGLLIGYIWHDELVFNKIVPDGITALSLFKKLAYNKDLLSSSEAITRCSRKLQEENVWLRGKLWDKRHARQAKIKKELKNFNNED